MTTTAAGTAEIRPRPTWAPLWVVPTAVLGAAFVLIGLTSPLQAVTWPAIVGGLLVVGALLLSTRSRPPAIVMLAVGAVLPVVTAWWSLVVPLTAVLTLICGSLAVKAMRPLPAPASGSVTGARAATAAAVAAGADQAGSTSPGEPRSGVGRATNRPISRPSGPGRNAS